MYSLVSHILSSFTLWPTLYFCSVSHLLKFPGIPIHVYLITPDTSHFSPLIRYFHSSLPLFKLLPTAWNFLPSLFTCWISIYLRSDPKSNQNIFSSKKVVGNSPPCIVLCLLYPQSLDSDSIIIFTTLYLNLFFTCLCPQLNYKLESKSY